MRLMGINIKTKIRWLLGLIILVSLLGILFFRYYQPYCEPCLSGLDCPPCISKEQYAVLVVYGILAISIVTRMVWLLTKNKK
jgi:hypothetical protein